MPSSTIEDMFGRARLETSPSLPATPNTRKRQRNYLELHNYGLQGPPPAAEASSPRTPATKRARRKSSMSFRRPTLQAAPQVEPITIDENNEPPSPTPQPKKKELGIKKHAWWWTYFDTKVLDKTFLKGKTGHRLEEVKDEYYTCNVRTGCRFNRYASNLHTSTTALRDHIIVHHKIHENSDPKVVRSQQPIGLQNWLKADVEELPSFENALLDWIVYDCQAFISTESKWFQRMLLAGGCNSRVPKGDAVRTKLMARVSYVEAELTKLFAQTASTIAVSLDGWTSQNSHSVLAANARWIGPDFKVYQRCIEFIEIEGHHSGENLAGVLEKALKKHGLCQKLLSITADNASNNDTLCRSLYASLSRKYDDHLEPFPSREGTMRFQGEKSQVRCFGHILNLVVKAILKDLGSSTHKDAVAYLDRAAEHLAKKNWTTIYVPGAAGVIAKLRLMVLWINRSPQRIQEWDRRPNTSKRVNYDVDTRWNFTLRMIKDAFDCKAALKDTCDDHPELKELKLSHGDWHQLENIQQLLTPFREYTEFVSREQPSLQLSARMYLELQSLLLKASRKQKPFSTLDNNLVHAVKVGIEKLEEYVNIMKDNDIYFLATILDPRIKTQWIRDNLENADNVIRRIRKFLKETYPHEPELPTADETELYKGLEYRFLQPYVDTDTQDEHDIDRYLDSPRVKHMPKAKEDQTQWILDWWKANESEYHCMAQAARDYLAIPSSEVDIERLFSLGRDILGVRRFSMGMDTMRTLVLLKDALKVTGDSSKR